MGGRADSAVVRTGAERARVEGIVADHRGRSRDRRGGRCRRRGRPDGARPADQRARAGRERSSAEPRCRRPRSVALSESLVAVHGQSDQHRLLRAGRAARRTRRVRRRRAGCAPEGVPVRLRPAEGGARPSCTRSHDGARARARGRPAPPRARGDRGGSARSPARTPRWRPRSPGSGSPTRCALRLRSPATALSADEQSMSAPDALGRWRRPAGHSTRCATTTRRRPRWGIGWRRSAICSARWRSMCRRTPRPSRPTRPDCPWSPSAGPHCSR